MRILHAFSESDVESKREHMRYWFGRPYNEEFSGPDGSYMICYCGGLLVPIARDKDGITVGAVWHERDFSDREHDGD